MNELSSRAHRISGAAALFEHAGIAKSARVLELAVVSASMLLASDADRAIAAALDDLMRLIESLDTESFNAQG
jgi:HPt (histidine-containing phosphotransfer) domain-containing protein